MGRRCLVCSLPTIRRLAIEEELGEGRFGRRALSKIGLGSHVSLGRHYRMHMRYPESWSTEVKAFVLAFGRIADSAYIDVFQTSNWEGWAQYQKMVAKARKGGYDSGYILTLHTMLWLAEKTELSGRIPALKEFVKSRPLGLLSWLKMETTSRGPGKIRYRQKFGFDGRSYVRRYKS